LVHNVMPEETARLQAQQSLKKYNS
jgi:hypothetical protein